jgi:anti-sigma factor RsiW
MICNEAHDLLHGYVDGELDVVRSIEVEEHLQSCRGCSDNLASLRILRQALQNPALYHRPPHQLRRDIAAAMQSKVSTATSRVPWRGLAIAASLLFAITLGWSVQRLSARGGDLLVAQITDAHVRSLLADHLSDVRSTDQHTVKPWFNGKLDFAPPVMDTATEGFPLTGGRLDYIDGRTVAGLVYQRRQHTINVFVWPASDQAELSATSLQHQGYNLVRWISGDMCFWAVSDLNAHELTEFANLLRNARPSASR